MKKFLFFLILLIAAAVAGRNVIVKYALQMGVEKAVGLPLSIGQVDISLKKTAIGIKDFHLKNPREFSEESLLEAPFVYVHYDAPALLRQEVHLKEVRLHLQTFMVVRNELGKLNIASFAGVKQKGLPKEEQEPAKSSGAPPRVKIDFLELKIGRVVYKDYSRGGTEPYVKEYIAKIDQEFRDIDDLQEVVQVIIFKAATRIPGEFLSDVDLGLLETTIKGTLNTAQNLATGTIEGATGAVKKAAEGITDLITSPFGKDK